MLNKQKKMRSNDPYISEISFQPARDFIKSYLKMIEKVKGEPTERVDQIIKILDTAGKQSKILIPSVGPDKAQKLMEIVKRHKPKKAYEIGTMFGYSTLVLAKFLPEDAIMFTIQKDKENMKIAKRIIKASCLSSRIKTIVGDATRMVPKIKGRFDMVFIDGYKPEYLKYLKMVEPKLNTGGLVVADNVLIFRHEMQDFLKYVRESGHYESKTVEAYNAFSTDTIDALEVSIKKK